MKIILTNLTNTKQTRNKTLFQFGIPNKNTVATSCKWIWSKTADLNIDFNNNPKSNINYTNKLINKYTNIINIHYPYVELVFLSIQLV